MDDRREALGPVQLVFRTKALAAMFNRDVGTVLMLGGVARLLN